MCDPVPSSPATNSACLSCGSQVEYEGNFLCDRCKRLALPALPPTGAAPSNPAVDPGLQSDRWSLHQQQPPFNPSPQVMARAAGLNPKDLTIEVEYHQSSRTVRVKLSHKPTGLSAEETGPDTVKEAIHSRLYGHLKGMVEKLQADAATIEKAFKANWAFHAFNRFVTLRMETKTPGFCDGPKYSEREAFEMAIAGAARTVPSDKEAAAKAIYRLFPDADGHPWVEGGNSLKQDDARRYAAAALSVAEARTVPEPQLVGELAAKYQMSRVMMEAILSDYLKGGQSPTPEQPSSQVHPDSALPSKVSE